MDYFEKQSSHIIDLGFVQEKLPLLKRYIDLLRQQNEELNLVSRQMSYEELIDNHVIDSLLPLKHLPSDAKKVADFGSGGGLPAIIYAIHLPKTQFLLYEKSPKKQQFLARCKEIAPNIEIHGEILPQFGGVDLVIARGFKPLDVIFDVSRNYYNAGGKYFLLKARLEKIEEELQLAKKKFKDVVIDIAPLQSPVLEVERHLVTAQRQSK